MNIAGAVITVGVFLFIHPVAGICTALVFGIVALRLSRR
jgi:hypothetical protein